MKSRREEATTTISVVFPCLNEADAVGLCVSEAVDGLKLAKLEGEILVVDNGSDDGSAEVAAASGARVVFEPQKGYGSALGRGIASAKGSIIVMADADFTYDLTRIPDLIQPILDDQADIVVADRLNGSRASMPILHRFLGTPILSALVRQASGGLSIRDSQSGFRAFRRSAIIDLGLQAVGMEFASEMLLKASYAGLRIQERPVAYRDRIGQSKLNTLSDGWRHLRLILMMAPHLLLIIPGIAISALGLVLSLSGILLPSGIEIGSLRWQPVYFSSITLFLGAQAVLVGMIMASRSFLVPRRVQMRFRFVRDPRFSSLMLTAGMVSFAAGFVLDFWVFIVWSRRGVLSNGLGLAALGQSLLLIGGSLVSTSVLARVLDESREGVLDESRERDAGPFANTDPRPRDG